MNEGRARVIANAREWADTGAPGEVGLLAQDYLVLLAALEHLAHPNRAVRATAQDARGMADYARRVLDGDA